MIAASENTATYSYEGVEFYYSAKYAAHIGIVSDSVSKSDILAGITASDAPADEILYNGDVTGDGRITAGDAAFCSQLLHDPDNPIYTAKMRLEADTIGEFITDYEGKYTFVSALDAMTMLLIAVGAYTL